MPPSPRGDTPHGPVYGASLKRVPECGLALPDTTFPGHLPPGVGDAGILEAETGEGAHAPLPVCPSPRGDTSHGPVSGENLRKKPVCGWGMPAYSVCPSPRGDTPHGPVNVYPREGQVDRGYSCFMKRCSAVVLPRSGGQDVSGALERGPDLVPFEDDPVAAQLGLRRPGVGVVAADQPPEPR